MTQPTVNKLDELIRHRKIDHEFLSKLVIIDQAPYKNSAMPGAIVKNPGPDPRLHFQSSIAKPNDELVLAERLATIGHKGDGRRFIIYRDTVDALMLESQDLQKYPKWLMDDPRKQNERSIRINEMVRAPIDKYDRGWLGDITETTYDTLAYFLYLQLQAK